MKGNGQNHVSFQLLSQGNRMFLLHGEASHIKPVEGSIAHCGSPSATIY